MLKKYEFTGETKEEFGVTFHRIRLLIDLPYFKKGSIGGWIEKESNLAHEGNCWVYGNSRVSGNSRVYGNAIVENVKIESISRNGYNINYSGVDRDSKEHLVRVGCQLHSISTWKNENTRKEIMRKNNFPSSLEQEFLQILNEIEEKYCPNTFQKIEENVQKLKISVTEPLKVETVSLVISLQVTPTKPEGSARDKFGRFTKKVP